MTITIFTMYGGGGGAYFAHTKSILYSTSFHMKFMNQAFDGFDKFIMKWP